MFLSRSSRSPAARGVAEVVLVLAVSLGFSACWVTSINPLYEKSTTGISQRDPEIVFEPSLVGSWVDVSDPCGTVTITSEDNEVYEVRSGSSGDKRCSESPTSLQARLLKLGTHYFMDISPMDDDVCAMCLPRHQVVLAEFDKTTLSLVPIDSDWLQRAVATKTVTLATLADNADTITASSRDLKAFCRKYAEDKEVFRADSNDAARLRRK